MGGGGLPPAPTDQGGGKYNLYNQLMTWPKNQLLIWSEAIDLPDKIGGPWPSWLASLIGGTPYQIWNTNIRRLALFSNVSFNFHIYLFVSFYDLNK